MSLEYTNVFVGFNLIHNSSHDRLKEIKEEILDELLSLGYTQVKLESTPIHDPIGYTGEYVLIEYTGPLKQSRIAMGAIKYALTKMSKFYDIRNIAV